MSTGGTYKFIVNDGEIDKTILVSDLLDARLRSIDGASQQPPEAESWNMPITEIEKTHSIFISKPYKPFVAMGNEYIKTNISEGSKSFGTNIKFNLPKFGEFISDAVVYVKLTGLEAMSTLDKVRYVSFLGHKIFKKVSFEFGRQMLDEYTSDDMNAYYNFYLPTHKRQGWLRNIGHETPNEGYLTANPATDEYREYRYIANGNQTFKFRHGEVELYIPLLFWWNELSKALPMMKLDHGTVSIDIQISKINELISFADYGGGGKYIEPKLDICLYVNNIFITPTVHNIFSSRFGFMMIRAHRHHSQTVQQSAAEIKLSNLKWAIESLHIAFRPNTNLDNSQTWHKNTVLSQQLLPAPVISGGIVNISNILYYNETPTIDLLNIKTSDIELYPQLPPSFYNSYLPWKTPATSTPSELGWYYMPFGLTPMSDGASGHINVTRAREFYLAYKSSFISPTNTTTLIVLATAINFLIVKNNSLTLKLQL
jgi:hypothetical protein